MKTSAERIKHAQNNAEAYSDCVRIETEIERRFPGALDIWWEPFEIELMSQSDWPDDEDKVLRFHRINKFKFIENDLFVEFSRWGNEGKIVIQWDDNNKFWFDPEVAKDEGMRTDYFEYGQVNY